MDSNTRVKECPYRIKQNYAIRGSDELDLWVMECGIQEHRYPDGITGPREVECHLHGNSKLNKCKYYNDHVEKELKEAFKKLDDLEKHRDALRAVMNM